MAAVPSWDTVTVHGLWLNQDGSPKPGSYKVAVPVRITNVPSDAIIPAGVFRQGGLNTAAGAPSLQLDVPISDDPDNSPSGWLLKIEVSFNDGTPTETYNIATPMSAKENGINLREVVFPSNTPAQAPQLVRGVPGGLAGLDVDGDVVDADGNKVTGGGGGSGTVESVNGVAPDTDGDVTLTADDIGALADTYTPPAQAWSQITSKPTTFPPATHTHTISEVSGLQSALDGKQPAGSYATAAQGAKADAAIQPDDLASVATTGLFTDLSGNPHPILVLGPSDPVPAGTADGTIILRTS